MYTRKEIDINSPLSENQIKMLEALKDTEPVYDEDCPELSDEELKEFKRASGCPIKIIIGHGAQ